jgi:hypothetical protein
VENPLPAIALPGSGLLMEKLAGSFSLRFLGTTVDLKP